MNNNPTLEPEVAAELLKRGENLRLPVNQVLKLWGWSFEQIRPYLISGEITAHGIPQPDGSIADVCFMSRDVIAFMARHNICAVSS